MTKNWSNQEEEVLQHLEEITLHQAAKSKRRRKSGDGGGMFGLSGDDAGQVVLEEEEEEEEEEQRRKLGGAGRNSHEVMLHAFATTELFKGPVGDGGGYPVESSLLMQQQGSIAAASSSMVDSSSELTTEGNVCGIGSAGAASSDGSLELRGGASTTLMDMLPGQTIIAAHESQQLSGLSPEVSPTVSGSSASTASWQNSGRVFSQLHLTGLDEKAFVSQESSSVCAPTDSIGSSLAAAPYLGVKSSCALTGISGPAPAAVAAPTLFRFSGSQAVCEEPNNIMMTAPDHMTAMLLRASFPSNCAAGDSSVEISGRPKRRNVRISKDPQSVAARHRRERISDRIRMLQRLVPGGTKMDTASMLDEAIHYVKFLKLQLQALEQLGSSFDPTFTMGMPAFQPCTSQPDSHPNGGTWRPFDLNCATYNQLAAAAAAAAASSPSSANASSNSGTPSHITGWPRASSSMCFPDHAQEQFCH